MVLELQTIPTIADTLTRSWLKNPQNGGSSWVNHQIGHFHVLCVTQHQKSKIMWYHDISSPFMSFMSLNHIKPYGSYTGWWFEPLWKIWKSIGMISNPILMGKCQKWQPNHQAAMGSYLIFPTSLAAWPQLLGMHLIQACRCRKVRISLIYVPG